MSFVIRMVATVVVMLIGAISQHWTESHYLRLGGVAAAVLGGLLLLMLWLTRPRAVGRIPLTPNYVRESVVGVLSGGAWCCGMLLYFAVLLRTPALVDRDRPEIEKVVARLESDANWKSAATVLLEALKVPHTSQFTQWLAERAIRNLTRSAETVDVAESKQLLSEALRIARQYGRSADYPQAVLARLSDRQAQEDLKQRLQDSKTHLASIAGQHEQEKAAFQQSIGNWLDFSSQLSEHVRVGELAVARDKLAAAITGAQQHGYPTVEAEHVLQNFEHALRESAPAPLPSGAVARLLRIHPGPTPNLLVLDIELTDANRRSITQLASKDFVALQSNRRKQVVASFLAHQESLNAFILVDTSISTQGDVIRNAKKAVSELLQRLPARTQLCLGSFSDRLKLLTRWTEDRSQAIAACQQLHADGRTALFSSVHEAVISLASRSGRRVLIVFSDGANSLAGPTPESVIAAANQANVTIHFVALKSAGYDDTSAIELIAKRTGGHTYLVQHAQELSEKFRLLATQLSESGYRLAILDLDPSLPCTIQIGRVHAVELTVPAQQSSSATVTARHL